ncbi:MAG TPA: hypothetical protein VG387_04485 [Rhizomicrobium sp.]|nr:hypothetical protein [Rhizomicrobium sp.]
MADAVKAFGIELIASPVSTVLGGRDPAFGARGDSPDMLCSSHHGIIVWPDLVSPSRAPGSAASAAAAVVAEPDRVAPAAEPWAVRIPGSGRMVID